MSIGINTTYAGEVLETFLVHAITGNDTVSKGVIKVQDGIQYKYVLPRLSLGNVIQDQEPTPSSSVGTYTIDERILEPKDFMVYLEFNPRDLEKFWKFAQPNGNLVFRELDPTVQIAFVQRLLKEVNNYLGKAIWHGKNTAGGTLGAPPAGGLIIGDPAVDQKLDRFDGLLYNILEDQLNGTEKPILSGSTELTTTTEIITALNDLYDAIPKSLFGSDKLRILMDWNMFMLYDKALTEADFKHAEWTGVNGKNFRGLKIVPLNGMPVSTIVACEATNGDDSNLWMGVDYQNDDNVIEIKRKQANSELYFFKMLMKADTVIAKPKELVYHTPYTLTA